MDIKEIQNLIKFVSKSGVEEVKIEREDFKITIKTCLLYASPSPRDGCRSRMPSSA